MSNREYGSDEVYNSLDLDIDIWRYGRNPNGKIDETYLRASYPYVESDAFDDKIRKILHENFERNHLDLFPFLRTKSAVFFQTKEDAQLFQGLLYIY